MKVVLKGNKDIHATFCHPIGSNYLNVFTDKAITIRADTYQYILEGTFYYSKNGTKTVLSNKNIKEVVANLIQSHGIETAHRYLEGVFVGVWIDLSNHTAGVFNDTLNQLPMYYTEENQEIVLSTQLSDLVNPKTTFNQFALYSYLLIGYPPEKETFYEGVDRIGSDTTLYFSALGFQWQHKSTVHQYQNFDAKDMNRYEDLLTHAVHSRSSDSNVVMSSGGWDSSSLLYLLNQNKGKNQLDSVVFNVILSDGQSFNKYEVDKAQRIGNYFNIGTQTAVIDYRDDALVDYWQSNSANLRENHTYFWLHHLKIADLIGNQYSNTTSIFNGEGADSIHNFGFSQFVSVNYDNMQLREYADKGKSYLYGPSFFESMTNDTYGEDKILKFFQNYHGAHKFENIGQCDIDAKRRSYFESFILSGARVPFATWQMPHLATDAMQKNYASHLHQKYFEDVVNQAEPTSIYYWLLQLYRRFHFHSYQIGITQVALNPYGHHCAMPFLDSSLLEFMYQMPENWGRGLELRTTKYPLRFLAENKWDMPLHILMEKGPHSYIAEGDKRWSYAGGNWNIYCEIMFQSPFADYFRSILRTAPLERVFDEHYFHLDTIRDVIKKYVGGEMCISDVNLLFRLALLFSIGFINLQ